MMRVATTVVVLALVSVYWAGAAFAPTRSSSSVVSLWEFKDGSGTTATDAGASPALDLQLTGTAASWIPGRHGVQILGAGSEEAGLVGDDAAGIEKLFASTENPYGWNYTMEMWTLPMSVPGDDSSSTVFQLCDSDQDFGNPLLRPPCLKAGMYTPSGSNWTYSFSWQLVYEQIGASALNLEAFGFTEGMSPMLPTGPHHYVARYTTTDPAPQYALTPGYAIGQVFINGQDTSDSIIGSRETEGLPINMWETTNAPLDDHTWRAHPLANRRFTVGYNYGNNGLVQSGTNFRGTVYLIALYDRALSDAEIADHYGAGPPSNAPVTAAYGGSAITIDENQAINITLPGTDIDQSIGWDMTLSASVDNIGFSSPIASHFTDAAAVYSANDWTRASPLAIPGGATTSLGAAGGVVTLVPTTGFYGTLTVTYRSVDYRETPAANTQSLSITVNNVEHAPTAVASQASTYAGQDVTITLDAGDLDPESMLQPTVTTLPSDLLYGRLFLQAADGGAAVVEDQILALTPLRRLTSLVFRPNQAMQVLARVPSVDATFQFRVTDSLTGVQSANIATATVSILNNAVAHTMTKVVNEDVRSTIQLSGEDLLGASLGVSFRIERLPTAGTLYQYGTQRMIAANDDVEDLLGRVDYLGAPDFFGQDTFRFTTISDTSLAESVPGVVTVNVTNVNDAPIPVDVYKGFFFLDGNTTVQLVVDEPDGDDVTFQVTGVPSSSLGRVFQSDGALITAAPVSVTSPVAELQVQATGTTQAGTQGYLISFPFTAIDIFLVAGEPAHVNVFVQNSFFAGNVTVNVVEDSQATFDLPIEDYFGRTWEAEVISLPSKGLLDIDPPARRRNMDRGASTRATVTPDDLPLATTGTGLTYVAGANQFGIDSFMYQATRTSGVDPGETVQGWVFFDVSPVSDLPLVVLPTFELNVVDHEVLQITTLTVQEPDDPDALLLVNITSQQTSTVAFGDSEGPEWARTVSVTGTAAEINDVKLAPLLFVTSPSEDVAAQIDHTLVVRVTSEGQTTESLVVIHVYPDTYDEDDRTLDATVVGAVVAAAAAALVFGAAGAYILFRRRAGEPKLGAHPDFVPYIFKSAPQRPSQAIAEPTKLKFMALLADGRYNLCFALFDVTYAVDSDRLAQYLMYAMEHEHKAMDLLATVISREIAIAPEPQLLFRSTSYACKMLAVYGQLHGMPYLYNTLGLMMAQIQAQEESLEVDPTKVNASRHPKFSPDAESPDVTVNKWHLLVVAQEFLKAILASADQVPPVFRQVCHVISQSVQTRFPEREPVAIGSFFFLRFLCPAIVQPENYGLVKYTPSRDMRRLLVLVAKTLQNLANNTTFREVHLEPMNVFIRANEDATHEFLRDIAGTAVPYTARDSTITIPDNIYNATCTELYLMTQQRHPDIDTLLIEDNSQDALDLRQDLLDIFNAPTLAPPPQAAAGGGTSL